MGVESKSKTGVHTLCFLVLHREQAVLPFPRLDLGPDDCADDTGDVTSSRASVW